MTLFSDWDWTWSWNPPMRGWGLIIALAIFAFYFSLYWIAGRRRGL